MTDTPRKTGTTRRGVLKGAAALAGTAAFPAPFVHAQERVTLRYLSTAVNLSLIHI